MKEKLTGLSLKMIAGLLVVVNLCVCGSSFFDSNSIGINNPHNCRFWGMLAIGTFDATNMRNHLDTLQAKASTNQDGWGIGFYTPTTRGYRIPVIYKGAWRADGDCRYDTAANFMLRNFVNSGVAHVRNKGSSPVGNCPNPHPFYTFGVYRDFNMLFAHNGSVDTSMLKKLIGDYKNVNRWDYWGTSTNDPIHDTDLFRLFLMSRIDLNPSVGITDCLVNALNEYVDSCGSSSVMNFVLASKYDTLWALRYNESLFYRLEIRIDENVWEVASCSLGGSGWTTADNYTLYVFKPNRTTPIKRQIDYSDRSTRNNDNYRSEDASARSSFFFCTYANTNEVRIEFNQQILHRMKISVFNAAGQSVSNPVNATLRAGARTLSYPVADLPNGVYFMKIKTDCLESTVKFTIIR